MTTALAGRVGFALVVTLLTAVLATAHFSTAGAQVVVDPGPPNGISVLGEGVVLAQPTQARTLFGVEVSNRSLAAAQREAASRMDAVITRLAELGVDRRDVKTIRFSVQPEYNHQVRPPTLVSYRVSNAVSVILRDVSAIGSIIDAVVDAGALRVEGVMFEIGDPVQVKEQSRELAMANARAKAEQLARLSGVALGKPIRIEESDLGGVRPVEADPAARAALAQADTPIEPGQLEVRTHVQVVYAIQ